MDNAHLNRHILRLALPSILANITIPLVGLVDTAIVGHLSDASAIGGIAVGTTLFDLLYWNFGFLRVGTSGITAQAFGRHDTYDCVRRLTQSLTIALCGAILILLLQWVFVSVALWCLPCSEAVASFARRYFFIRIWAAPATLSLMTFKGWFIGMQDTVSAMVVDIVVNGVNMLASFLLAVYTPLGVLGVAYGTLIAQYTGLLTALTLVAVKYNYLFREVSLKVVLCDLQGMRRFMSLNGNLFIRSLCFMVVYVGYTALASNYGDTNLAALGILMKLFMLVSFFVDGFAYAGEALVGNYIVNVNHRSLISPLIRSLAMWSLGIGAIMAALFACQPSAIYHLMTTDVPVVSALTSFTVWLILMPLVSALAFMWDGVYAGATAGVQIRNAMIYAALAFVLGYVVCFRFLDVYALLVAYFFHLIVRVVYLTFNWKSVYDQKTSKSPLEGA